jgi:hypothetical protein
MELVDMPSCEFGERNAREGSSPSFHPKQYGELVELVNTSPFQGEDRRFKPDTPYQIQNNFNWR